MSIELQKRDFITLTPRMAEHYLNFNDYPSQRPVRTLHVEELYEKMKDGLFRFGEVAFGSLNGKKEVMMNGQHVCHALIKYGKSTEAVVEHYNCDSKISMSQLFRQFEILPRSIKDFIKHEAAALGVTWPLWVSSLVVAAACIDYLSLPSYGASGVSVSHSTVKDTKIKSYLTKEAKVKLLENYLEEGQFINDILTCDGEFSSSTKKGIVHLKRAPVVFFMMECWRVNIKNAREFWMSVRDGEALIKEMPEYRYREFLLTSNIRSRARISGNASSHEYVYKGHLAWNAFREGRTTLLAYRANGDPPRLV